MLFAPQDTYPRLVGDIGGTNARFALIRAPGQDMEAMLTLPCADFPGPAEAIEHYTAKTGGPRPRWCAFGIANPIDGDFVKMTNHHWAFSIDALQARLELAHLQVINDFTALALALPALTPTDLVAVGRGAAVARRAIGLLGAGTGLGISGLVPTGEDYVPLEGEGGHVTLAANNAHEAALIAWLATRYPHVSAERVLSGPGLVALYEAHAAVAGVPADGLSAAEISSRGLAGASSLCVETLNTFCAFLGTVAADLALILGARGGVYIGGGIVPKLGEFFARSPFRARFEDKGRFSAYLAQIPTWVIQAPYPGLVGAARALERAACAAPGGRSRVCGGTGSRRTD
ncbi:glucokinase [Aromatoleum petrolei]|uniref:Glucokinase n=1 Tax=Aromatoleum petrolei TaxID=76116 RepID=A0ABX1MJC5_9RHOO|nr:glucokinase [Aromatoleum petrolei]NMF87250.1 glucokinase [Aromatoleum petrolei]QTQ38494.1 Glucokinase [Aromatoleum petrolei]